MKYIGAYHAWRRGWNEEDLSALFAALDEADALGNTVLARRDLPEAWQQAAVASPLIRLSEDWLWLERTAAAEEDLAQSIMARLAEIDTPAVAPEGILQTLNSAQQSALQQALRKRFCIINGGPGTGKTYTLARLVQCLRQQQPDLRLALTAPTGKAAQRMQESLQRAGSACGEGEAFTVHRLLAYQHGRFQYHAARPLPYDLIIVDEASMLSLDLARALFAAVAPTARLILLGDAHQLAAVEAGAVLRDLIEAPALAEHRVTLQESKRFSAESPIGQWAQAALAGKMSGLPYQDLSQPEALLQPYQPYFKALQNAAPLADLWHSFEQYRILCAVREGLTGTYTFNQMAMQHLQALFPQWQREGFQHGLPVMLHVNDYRLRLFNGDIGLCLWQNDAFYLHFPQREALPLTEFNRQHLAPAFALTVHKSQGSEYDSVALCLPESSPILSRELLYTGITRARHELHLYASESALRQALNTPTQRRTGLAYFLRQTNHAAKSASEDKGLK